MPAENKPRAKRLSRRQAIRGEWLAAPAGGPPPPHALRSPNNTSGVRAVGDPALPPLGIIVLNRLGFGPRPGDLAAFNALSSNDAARLILWVDSQLNPGAINDSVCDAKLNAAGLPTLNKSLPQLWADHYNGSLSRTEPISDIRDAAMLRAVYSQRQLFEVLADFWHNHFSVYAWDYAYASATWVSYDRDVIRGHALGNFRAMLEAVIQSPAMLYYLTNYINQVAGTNENLGRELFELHTMGTENYAGVVDPFGVPKDLQGVATQYCDNDVYETARCLTGWRVNDGNSQAPADNGTFFYYAAWHDKANKLVLGKYLSAFQADLKDMHDVLDLLANHTGTADFVARKLCRRLVSDTPSQALVDMAAGVFHAQAAAPDQLKQVVKAILFSNEFQTTWGQKVKRPFEAVAGALRATNANFLPDGGFWYYYEQAGQALFAHHSPDGYHDTRADWSNTNSLLERWRVVNYLVQDVFSNTTLDLPGQMPGSVNTPNGIAGFWINRLLGRPMDPAANRLQVVNFMAQGRNPDFALPADQILERLPHMVALILMSPDFQWR